MTKNELIYLVYDRLKISSDDTDLSPELVSFQLDATRAKFIKNQYGNKDWNIPIELKQELCLGLEVIGDVNGVDCFGTILRTTEVIPRGIKVKGSDSSILRIRTYDRKQLALNIISMDRLPYIGHNQFTAMMTYAAIDVDGRIYFLSNNKQHKFMEAIKVEGIFENPDSIWPMVCNEITAAQAATSKDLSIPFRSSKPCAPWDEEYPMEGSMIDEVMDQVIKHFSRREALPEDKLNDGEDDRG